MRCVTVLGGAVLAAGLLVVCPSGSRAQVITGRVVEGAGDGAPRRPLVGVPIRLLRAAAGDTAAPADTTPLATGQTASDGVFALLAPGPGTYRARVGTFAYGPVVTFASSEATDEREYVVGVDYGSVFTEAGVDSVARVAPPGYAAARIRYPAHLQRAGTQGVVVLLMIVDTAGAMEPGTLAVQQATHRDFGAVALDALRGAHFTPAVRNGRHVRQLVTVPVTFALGRPPAPPRPGERFNPNEIVVVGFSFSDVGPGGYDRRPGPAGNVRP